MRQRTRRRIAEAGATGRSTPVTTAAAAGADDTFPKLLARNAPCAPGRPAFRHKDLGIWQSWTWAEVHEIVRAYAAGLKRLGVERGGKIAIVGANRPRLYWTMAAAQWLGRRAGAGLRRFRRRRDGLRARPCGGDARGGAGPGAGRQAPLRRRPHAAPPAHPLRRGAGPAGLRPCPPAPDRRGDRGGTEPPRRPPDRAAGDGARARGRQGLGPRHHPLHLRHHGAAEGGDAHLRQRHRRRAHRLRLRQARRDGRDHRLPADRLGRRPHLLLRAGDPRGLVRQLPREPGHGGRGPARDRHHLRLRAAARVRDHADADHGAHGGRERPEAPGVPLLHRPRRRLGREDPQRRARAG